jgi:hypothetical protein
MTRATIVEGSFEPDATQTEIEVPDERAHLGDYVTPERGLKGGTLKLATHLRPPSTQITGAGTAASHYLAPLFNGTFGTDSVSGGDTLSAATSATSFTATTIGRYTAGQWMIVTTASGIEPVRTKSFAGSVITAGLGASATPSVSTTYGMSNWHLVQANTNAVTVEHAMAQDSGPVAQWRFNGCAISGLSISTERDALIKVSADMKVGTWLGPANCSLTATHAAESMGSPFALRDYTCIMQPVATATRTHVPIESVSYELQFGMDHVPELANSDTTGTAEGKVGVYRFGSVKPFAKAKVRMRMDSTVTTYWSSKTPLQFVLMVPQGTGSTKRWLVLDMPTCIIVGKPQHPNGDRELIEFTLHSQLNTNTALTTDLALSPFILALG